MFALTTGMSSYDLIEASRSVKHKNKCVYHLSTFATNLPNKGEYIIVNFYFLTYINIFYIFHSFSFLLNFYFVKKKEEML